MDGGRKKRVGVKRSSKVDWLSNLPESFLCKVLMNLPTKDVVKCSVLSKDGWRHVPGLDLNGFDFPKHITFASFVDAFLGFTHLSTIFEDLVEEDHIVAVNAPRLQHVRLGDDSISSYVLNNTTSLVEAYIDSVFNFNFENKFENDLQRRKMIRSLLEGISCINDMTITSKTLEVIYHYSRCEQYNCMKPEAT